MKKLIDEFLFCPKCGNHMNIIGSFRECKTCGFRVFFNPSINVSLLILDGHGRDGLSEKVQLCWRLHEPKGECWQINGGFVNEGESLEEAAVRNATRELGGDVKFSQPTYLCSVPETDYVYQKLILPLVCLYFKAWLIGGKPKSSSEVGEIRSFSSEEIPWEQIGFECDKFALRTWAVMP